MKKKVLKKYTAYLNDSIHTDDIGGLRNIHMH